MRRLKRNSEVEDEKGMMGVGTLMIFIAIVLVSAVSAGVFIRTVTMLKQQAEQSAEEAMAEVSTYIKVRSMLGIRNKTGTGLKKIYVNLGVGPGTPPQNLENLLIQVDNGDAQKALEYSPDKASGENFTAVALKDPEGEFDREDNPLISSGTTLQLTFNITQIDGNTTGSFDLPPQTEMNIQFTPKHGASTIEILVTPSVYHKDIMHL